MISGKEITEIGRTVGGSVVDTPIASCGGRTPDAREIKLCDVCNKNEISGNWGDYAPPAWLFVLSSDFLLVVLLCTLSAQVIFCFSRAFFSR